MDSIFRLKGKDSLALLLSMIQKITIVTNRLIKICWSFSSCSCCLWLLGNNLMRAKDVRKVILIGQLQLTLMGSMARDGHLAELSNSILIVSALRS